MKKLLIATAILMSGFWQACNDQEKQEEKTNGRTGTVFVKMIVKVYEGRFSLAKEPPNAEPSLEPICYNRWPDAHYYRTARQRLRKPGMEMVGASDYQQENIGKTEFRSGHNGSARWCRLALLYWSNSNKVTAYGGEKTEACRVQELI